MNITSTDTQLEYELQDLYIASKHWLSDIAFAEDEAKFFHTVIDKYIKPDIINGHDAKLHHCKMMLYQQQFEVIDLRNNVAAYLAFLTPLISDTSKKIGIELIETHSMLTDRIAALLDAVRLLKAELFALAEDVIDNERNLFI
ncbi:hypothetical protein KXQ82_14895 [Mucilaginibacter sp. HMF5004]|uniref:hypothetical protein n=1 Tax=Mucilaginibacter rivuli TaxID=2857527 RepID=UPI001C5D37C9|nr:hypothetical protein [Mucilaginibacter rivuli]MBW4891011.1 hypothetical protein [Mucilaginibacter rivuli]